VGPEPGPRRASGAEPPPPPLDELGRDLLATTRRQRWLALARPLAAVAAFAIVVRAGLWPLAPLAVFLLFVAVVTVAHDLVHGSLGLGPRATDWALFVAGALVLESGHAYRLSHRQHHRVFPGPDDPEGDPARMSLRGALAHGPLFLPRLWLWAWGKSARRPNDRRWLAAEAAWAIAAALASVAIALAGFGLAPVAYVVMVVAGSWVYPLLTVHLPHFDYGATPLTQTRTLRGRVIPALFLELTYHLEHHLYPQVPSHHLASLSRRLEPYFRANGVAPWRVP
jgi:beta-carotene hydroxylase